MARQQRVEDARERAFVPATSIILLCAEKLGGRRDKSGDDANTSFGMIEICSEQLPVKINGLHLTGP